MLIALTGATGFIGQHLLHGLPKSGHRVRVLLRRPACTPMPVASAVIGDLARPQNMSAALEGVSFTPRVPRQRCPAFLRTTTGCSTRKRRSPSRVRPAIVYPRA